MRVQIGEYVARGGPGTRQPGPDQPHPLLLADDLHVRIFGHVAVELLL